ncbi:MAG: hypothetical protein EOO60_11390 [Hymenobacter sp.]|nr:MAG: hypothetical protein EOO60_11390 [Hymenobacter sp.]
MATANALYGGLLEKNQRPVYRPDGSHNYTYPSLGRAPYLEVGYGVENIFKFIRVDFIHRLTYRNATDRGGDNPDPNLLAPRNFGIRVGAQFRL